MKICIIKSVTYFTMLILAPLIELDNTKILHRFLSISLTRAIKSFYFYYIDVMNQNGNYDDSNLLNGKC